METIGKKHALQAPIVRINKKAKKLLVKGFFKIPEKIKENKDFIKHSEKRAEVERELVKEACSMKPAERNKS